MNKDEWVMAAAGEYHLGYGLDPKQAYQVAQKLYDVLGDEGRADPMICVIRDFQSDVPLVNPDDDEEAEWKSFER